MEKQIADGLTWIIPVVLAITLHEAAHGYVARYFGDPTAYQLGRVSPNPVRHIDLVGTILVPALTLLFGGILFGWAKPVPIDEVEPAAEIVEMFASHDQFAEEKQCPPLVE